MTGERALSPHEIGAISKLQWGASLTYLWDTGINKPMLHQLNGKLASAIMCVPCSLRATAVPDF